MEHVIAVAKEEARARFFYGLVALEVVGGTRLLMLGPRPVVVFDWSFDFWYDDLAKYKFDELFASDALLLGRMTYEAFAKAWQTMTDDAGSPTE